MVPHLNKREQEILTYTIHHFIDDASPVGSGKIVSNNQLDISSATVRNTLNSLEKKGYLNQPHTSAGRVPTQMGYRYYVNSLMQIKPLNQHELNTLEQIKKSLFEDFDSTVFQAAQLLARLSSMLTVIISPSLAGGVLQKIDLINVSSSKLLVVLTIRSGYVKTINVEVEHQLNRNQLTYVNQILNERLSGHLMSDITEKVDEMLADKKSSDSTGLIEIFIDSADTIFAERSTNKFYYGGVEYMALIPEFRDEQNYRKILEILENENLMIHLMDQMNSKKDVNVQIGKENNLQQIKKCSVVSASYNMGQMSGKVGLVGPTRMNYGKMVSLINTLILDISNTGTSN